MPTPAIPFFDSAARGTAFRRRFACALVASIVAHALWLAIPGGMRGAGEGGPPAERPALNARLQGFPIELERPSEAADAAVAVSNRDEVPKPDSARGGPASQQAEPAAPRHPPRDEPASAAVSDVLADSTYYPVRQLDVLPSLVTAVRLDYPERAAKAGVAGRLLVMLLIDETGSVNDVTVVDADPQGYFEESVRSALSVARFTPARRADRPVRSRVLVSVNYSAGDGAGTLR